MGMYDEYNGVQLKVGDCTLTNYSIGDKVPIEDGVYVAYEGVVVIYDGILLTTFLPLVTKYGDKLSPSDIVDQYNPIKKALAAPTLDTTGWTESIWSRERIQDQARVYAKGNFTQVLVDFAQEVCRLNAELAEARGGEYGS